MNYTITVSAMITFEVTADDAIKARNIVDSELDGIESLVCGVEGLTGFAASVESIEAVKG